jgi:hypothetical protein
MSVIVPPDATRAIVKDDGKMYDAFSLFVQQVARLGIITGEGSPEGAIGAIQGQEYMDTIGTAGAIKYIKRDAAIGGDKTQGWILI